MIEAIASVKHSHSAFRHGTDSVPSSTSKWQINVNQGPRDAVDYTAFRYLQYQVPVAVPVTTLIVEHMHSPRWKSEMWQIT